MRRIIPQVTLRRTMLFTSLGVAPRSIAGFLSQQLLIGVQCITLRSNPASAVRAGTSLSFDFESYRRADRIIPVPHAVFPASIRPFFDYDIVRDSRQHGLVSI